MMVFIAVVAFFEGVFLAVVEGVTTAFFWRRAVALVCVGQIAVAVFERAPMADVLAKERNRAKKLMHYKPSLNLILQLLVPDAFL